MTDRYLIPLPGVGTLVLEASAFESALEEGGRVKPATRCASVDESPLVDAETLAAQLNLPQSWIEQRTREDLLPCYRAGRWIRYRRGEVEATLRAEAKAA
jgi:hypothetical protein